MAQARYRITGDADSYCYALQKFEFNTSQGEYWRTIDCSKDRSFLEDRMAYATGDIMEREFCRRNIMRNLAKRSATRKR